jgi:hypothetical protein
MPADLRFLKFRQDYTTSEHLLTLEDLSVRNAAVTSAGFASMSEALGEQAWAIESGFDALSDAIYDLRASVEDGFRGLYEVVTWGVARLCWEHEQDREIYRQQLDVLRHPLGTQALEHREWAEKHIRNHHWPEAVAELEATLADSPYDFLAHLQLAQIWWYRHHELGEPEGAWDRAIEHFRLASRYSDTAEASEQQLYYACLAYAHLALLYRLDAQTFDERFAASMATALESGERAVALGKDVPLALVEYVLDCLLVGDEPRARRATLAAAAHDEELLLALESSPDLVERADVAAAVAQWRAEHAGLLETARTIAGAGTLLVQGYVPELAPQSAAVAALPPDLTGRGTKPATTVREAMDRLNDLLVSAGNRLHTHTQTAQQTQNQAAGYLQRLQYNRNAKITHIHDLVTQRAPAPTWGCMIPTLALAALVVFGLAEGFALGGLSGRLPAKKTYHFTGNGLDLAFEVHPSDDINGGDFVQEDNSGYPVQPEGQYDLMTTKLAELLVSDAKAGDGSHGRFDFSEAQLHTFEGRFRDQMSNNQANRFTTSDLNEALQSSAARFTWSPGPGEMTQDQLMAWVRTAGVLSVALLVGLVWLQIARGQRRELRARLAQAAAQQAEVPGLEASLREAEVRLTSARTETQRLERLEKEFNGAATKIQWAAGDVLRQAWDVAERYRTEQTSPGN